MFSGCLEQSGCKVLAHTYPRAHTHDSWRCGPLFHALDEAHAWCCRGAFCGSICVKICWDIHKLLHSSRSSVEVWCRTCGGETCFLVAWSSLGAKSLRRQTPGPTLMIPGDVGPYSMR